MKRHVPIWVSFFVGLHGHAMGLPEPARTAGDGQKAGYLGNGLDLKKNELIGRVIYRPIESVWAVALTPLLRYRRNPPRLSWRPAGSVIFPRE